MTWISAEEALQRLGVKPQTLYANVSRGRIHARPDPKEPRRSLYQAKDVDRLAARRAGRRPAESVAAEAIRWGDPVLPTAISTISQGRLFYRGQDAAALSRTATLEETAALLFDSSVQALPPVCSAGQLHDFNLTPAFLALAARAASDLPALGRSPGLMRREAGEVFASLAGSLAPGDHALLHHRLACHWQRPEAAEVLRQVLVLLAEHELNASTFAARVTASTGAPLAASALAGLSALAGPRHGGAWESVAALAQHARIVGAGEALRRALAGEGALRGFGHPLYPEGDVRAVALLGAFDLPPVFAALAEAGRELLGEEPNVDFLLSAITLRFDLPAKAPILLFALARTTGWLAHALEQIETGHLIRPRADYVGIDPERYAL